MSKSNNVQSRKARSAKVALTKEEARAKGKRLLEKWNMDEASREYAIALVCCHACKPCGIPRFPPLPSLKVASFAKGTFYGGTVGVGFVGVDPFAVQAADATSGASPIMYTGSAFAQAILDWTFNATGMYTERVNVPYDAADFGAKDLQWRLVALCLRVRYIGNTLYNEGGLVGLSHPDNQTIDTYTAGNFLSHDRVSLIPLEKCRDWVQVSYRPSTESNFSYSETAGSASVPTMGFMVTGANTTTPPVFAWEVHCIHEFIGVLARGKSQTKPSPMGFNAVVAAADKLTPGARRESNATAPSFLSSVERGLREIAGPVKSAIDLYSMVAPALAAL